MNLSKLIRMLEDDGWKECGSLEAIITLNMPRRRAL
jgi:hypothetical protein